MNARTRSFVLSLALTMGASACATQSMAKHAAKGATQGLAEDATGEKGPEATKHVLGVMLSDPAVRKAARELARESVAGAIDGLSEVDARDRTRALVSATMRDIAPGAPAEQTAAKDDGDSRLRGALEAAVAQSVRAAMREVRISAKEDAPELTEILVETTTRAVMKAMAEAATTLEAQQRLAGDTFPRAMSREVTLGLGDGAKQMNHDVVVAAMHDVGAGLGAGVIESLPGTATSLRGPLLAVAIVGAALFALGAAFLVSFWRQQQLLARALTALAQTHVSPDVPSPPRPTQTIPKVAAAHR